jgi:hypothetical protein
VAHFAFYRWFDEPRERFMEALTDRDARLADATLILHDQVIDSEVHVGRGAPALQLRL